MKKNRLKSNIPVKKIIKKKTKQNQIIKSKKNKEKENSKNANIVFGLDNGSTGTICCIIPEYNYVDFKLTPNKECLDYPKEIQYINRIDVNELKKWFEKNINNAKKFYKNEIKIIVILQRPMVNPQRFKQSGFALRAFEATLLVLQSLNLNYIIIDSKKWQHYFFGKNTSQIDLKLQSMNLGIKILQNIKTNINQKEIQQMIEIIKKHGDADGLLISKFGTEKMI